MITTFQISWIVYLPFQGPFFFFSQHWSCPGTWQKMAGCWSRFVGEIGHLQSLRHYGRILTMFVLFQCYVASSGHNKQSYSNLLRENNVLTQAVPLLRLPNSPNKMVNRFWITQPSIPLTAHLGSINPSSWITIQKSSKKIQEIIPCCWENVFQRNSRKWFEFHIVWQRCNTLRKNKRQCEDRE